MAARPSEIRAFLLKYAVRRGILISEYVSDFDPSQKTAYYCHLEGPISDPRKSATAISYEHADNSLVMAFLNYGDCSLDFLDN